MGLLSNFIVIFLPYYVSFSHVLLLFLRSLIFLMRQKESVYRWEGKWRGIGWSKGRRNSQIYCIRKESILNKEGYKVTSYLCLQKAHLTKKYMQKLRMKEWKHTHQANINTKLTYSYNRQHMLQAKTGPYQYKEHSFSLIVIAKDLYIHKYIKYTLLITIIVTCT